METEDFEFSMISEQVKELKLIADKYEQISEGDYLRILKAADTIEALSAKLQAANMERSEM